MEETQLIDLKNEDNRTAEVTIIDDDEPGVIAFQAPPPGRAARRPATRRSGYRQRSRAASKFGHARAFRVGRFNARRASTRSDFEATSTAASSYDAPLQVNGKHYKAQNHPITFHNTEVEKFLEVELLHTGLEDGVEFTVVLENVRSDHKERQPSLGHPRVSLVHIVADADEKRHMDDIHAYLQANDGSGFAVGSQGLGAPVRGSTRPWRFDGVTYYNTAVEADLCDGGAYLLLWGLVMFLSSSNIYRHRYGVHR